MYQWKTYVSYKLSGAVNNKRGNTNSMTKTTQKTCTKTKENETQNLRKTK